MKTRKVLDINTCGSHLKGYYEEGKTNPWRLYKLTWKHRLNGIGMSESKQMIGKWANFISMVETVNVYFRGNKAAWVE